MREAEPTVSRRGAAADPVPQGRPRVVGHRPAVQAGSELSERGHRTRLPRYLSGKQWLLLSEC